MIDSALRERVRRRAAFRCEYCQLGQEHLPFLPFHIEHVVPRQHEGDDTPENLALSCDRCNLYKGPNLSAIDPLTRQVVPLFNPRTQVWADHFRISEHQVVGLTPTGRATARLLNMNAAARVQLRRDADASE